MLQIKKLTIGVQPVVKMFRLQSAWGGIFDAIFSSLGTGVLEADFFNGVAAPRGIEQYQTRNEDKGNFLSIGMDNIVFTKSFYDKEGGVSVDKFISEFSAIWAITQKRLNVSNIRRIGMVAEHRKYNVEFPSKYLMSRLSTLDMPEVASKFSVNFEARHPTSSGKSGSRNEEDFLNLIHQLYDSSMDSEFPEARAVNYNLDVQRYYSPLLVRDEVDHFRILAREFDKRWRDYQAQLSRLGLLDDVK